MKVFIFSFFVALIVSFLVKEDNFMWFITTFILSSIALLIDDNMGYYKIN